ncbi:hypothetical protein ACJ72_01586 [Emergomyces africanus]|uniref:Uncharacterized protein n=1 Tax=Emergomyces africanus TaxID=1955775 RepID=A0A1B7P4T5_9EURO|nr:hypothetical protein ACJ72_01586 [Emergomyces africanus]
MASSAGATQSPMVAHHLRSLGAGSDPSPPSPQKIFNEIIHKIPTIQKFTEIIYEHISPSDGALICQSLAASKQVERRNIRINFNAFTETLRIRIMPTELHDAHQRWAIDALVEWTHGGLVSLEEQRNLDAGVGTTFDGFTGVYQSSHKEPDFVFRADTDDFPSIVIESSWSESFPYLQADKDLWFKGNNSVQLVILLKWSKISGGRVKGSAEIWRRDGTGNLVATEMIIFPVPDLPVLNERIEFTKGQLFGTAAIRRQEADTLLHLRMSRLREIAEERLLKKMGLNRVKNCPFAISQIFGALFRSPPGNLPSSAHRVDLTSN